MSTADNGKAKGTLLLCLDELRLCLSRSCRLIGLALHSAELFCVGEDEVHVLVEGEHLASHLTTVHHCDAQAVVDQALHLALLVCGGHTEGRCARTRLVRKRGWMVLKVCANAATRPREAAEGCDGRLGIDGWMARITELVALALSSRRQLAPAVLCLASLRQDSRLPSPHPPPKRSWKLSCSLPSASPFQPPITHRAMAATKMQTPLSLLRASAPLGRSVHTSISHSAQRSQALSSALVLSRHASSAASTSTTSTQSQTPQLTWDEFLKLRRTRRFINLGSSALSGAASVAVAVPAFAEFEIENIGAQMTGLDPMFIIGGSLMGVGAVGWLLGPFLGTAFFNVWKGSVRKEFARVRHGPASLC